MEIDEFAKTANAHDWLEEPVGFSIDVEAALGWPPIAFKHTSQPPKSRDDMVFELEWIGGGQTMADLSADFFRAYGRFAEEAQFIARKVDAPHVVYEVVVGDERHGHRATFRIGGDQTARMVAWYLKNAREVRKLPIRKL